MGRVTGLLIIVGAVVVSLVYSDVFGQFKMAMELPILFAAPFWIGMYWRRSNGTAVWGTIFAPPTLLCLTSSSSGSAKDLRVNPRFSAVTDRVTKTFIRQATESDVSRYQAWIRASEKIHEKYDGTMRTVST